MRYTCFLRKVLHQSQAILMLHLIPHIHFQMVEQKFIPENNVHTRFGTSASATLCIQIVYIRSFEFPKNLIYCKQSRVCSSRSAVPMILPYSIIELSNCWLLFWSENCSVEFHEMKPFRRCPADLHHSLMQVYAWWLDSFYIWMRANSIPVWMHLQICVRIALCYSETSLLRIIVVLNVDCTPKILLLNGYHDL